MNDKLMTRSGSDGNEGKNKGKNKGENKGENKGKNEGKNEGKIALNDIPGQAGKSLYPWSVVAILLLVYIIANIDRHILSVLVEPIKRDLSLSDTQMSLLLGFAFAFFYTLVGLPIARLADRSSRRNIIAFGVVTWSLATSFCGMARNYGQLFFGRIFVGLGEACLNPAAIPLISDYFDKNKLGRALGIYMLGIPLGSGLATIIGGNLYEYIAGDDTVHIAGFGEFYSWQLILFILGVSGLVIALLLSLIREPARQGAVKKDASGNITNYSFQEIYAFLCSNWRLLVCVAWPLIASAMMTFGVGYWIPSFFVRSFSLSESQAGDYLHNWGLVNLGFGVAGVLIGGFLVDSLNRRYVDGHFKTLCIGMLLMGPAYSLFAIMPDPSISIMLLAPAALGGGILQTCGVVVLMMLCPNQMRAQISALFFFLVNLFGAVLGPTLVAVLTDYVFGSEELLKYSLFTVTVFMTVSSLMVLIIGRPRNSLQPDAGSTA